MTTDSLRKDRLLLAKDFSLYYGYGKVKELSRYDVVIIEPKGLSKEDITLLRNHNTLVVAYLSMVEVHPTDSIYSQLTEDDFLTMNHQRIENKSYGTYLVSLNSKRWIKYLLQEIGYRINHLGADGIFMDTIGDLEMTVLSDELRQQQIIAFTNFLYTIRLQFPHHLLVQNNGLEKVVNYTVPFIDGIMWENPPLTLKESQAWVDRMIGQFDALQKENPIRILLLFDEMLEQNKEVMKLAKKLAKEQGYLVYKAPKQYLDVN